MRGRPAKRQAQGPPNHHRLPPDPIPGHTLDKQSAEESPRSESTGSEQVPSSSTLQSSGLGAEATRVGATFESPDSLQRVLAQSAVHFGNLDPFSYTVHPPAENESYPPHIDSQDTVGDADEYDRNPVTKDAGSHRRAPSRERRAKSLFTPEHHLRPEAYAMPRARSVSVS